MAVDFAVDHDDGSHAACAEAAEDAEEVLSVGRGLAFGDAELALELVDDLRRALDEAGGAGADVDGVAADRLVREEAVEADHAVDFREGDTETFGDERLDFDREIAEEGLGLVKRLDQESALTGRVVGQRQTFDVGVEGLHLGGFAGGHLANSVHAMHFTHV